MVFGVKWGESNNTNRNLQFAAEQLESTGIIGLIEPINNYSLPGYYLNCYDKGAFVNYI